MINRNDNVHVALEKIASLAFPIGGAAIGGYQGFKNADKDRKLQGAAGGSIGGAAGSFIGGIPAGVLTALVAGKLNEEDLIDLKKKGKLSERQLKAMRRVLRSTAVGSIVGGAAGSYYLGKRLGKFTGRKRKKGESNLKRYFRG